MDAAADAGGCLCSGVHRGALAERDSLLPQMVGKAGERREAAALALPVGFGSGDEFGGLTFWSADESKCGYAMTVTRTVWGFIEQRDHRLVRRMNRWRAPRWIRYWVIAATRMGDRSLWDGLRSMLVVYGRPQRFSAIRSAGSSAHRRNFVIHIV